MAGALRLKPNKPTGLSSLFIGLPILACFLFYYGGQLHSAAAIGTQLQLQAPQAATGLHGRVHKVGPIELRRFHPKLLSSCAAERLNWTATAASGNLTQAELSDPRRFPCVECQVFVNHMYKMIYLRQPKAGSTTLLKHFGKCTEAEPVLHEETGCLYKWEVGTLVPTSPDVAARPTYVPLQHLTDTQIAEVWQDYFVFTHVRDPFSRAVSQYRHCLGRNLAEPAECAAMTQELDWNGVCASPLKLTEFCARRPHCCVNTFENNIKWQLHHLAPLKGCMTTHDGRLAVDFVVRVEHMAEDLADMLQQLNARDGVPKLELAQNITTVGVWHRCTSGKSELWQQHKMVNKAKEQGSWVGPEAKEQYCTVDEYYIGQHEHCRAGVTAYFAEDLQLVYGSQ